VKNIRNILFLIIIFCGIISFLSINIYGFDLYFGAGFIASSSYPISLTNNIDSLMRIYNGDTVFAGISFNIGSNYSIGIEIAYLSKGLFAVGDFYYLFFNGLTKIYISKNLTGNGFFKFNFGVWLSALFYCAYKSRNFNDVIDVLNINDFSFFNFGPSFGYSFVLKKIVFSIEANLGILDENLTDTQYYLSAWITAKILLFL